MRFRSHTTLLLMVGPLVVYSLWFAVPLIANMRMSLNSFSHTTGLVETVDAGGYATVLTSRSYLISWGTTLRIALESAVLTTVLGAVLAYFLWTVGGRLRAYLTLVLLTPLLISGVVRVFGWIATLGPNGLLPALAASVGLPPFSIMFNEAATLIGFVHVFLPYVVIIALAALDGIDPAIVRASLNLGAHPFETVRRVIFPLCQPALSSSVLFVFAATSTSYVIPSTLGGGRVPVVAIDIVQAIRDRFDWPLASALSMALILLSVGLLTLGQLIRRGARRAYVSIARGIEA